MARPIPVNEPAYIGPFCAQPGPLVQEYSQGIPTVGARGASPIFNGNAQAGLYLVTITNTITTVGTGGTIRMQVSATGIDGVTVYSLPALDVTVANNRASATFVVESNGAADMFFSIVFAGVTVSPNYVYRYVVNFISNAT